MLALLLPLVCYFIVKKSSEKATQMPRHYIYDTVMEKTADGKRKSDTVWHRVPDFKLINQLGDSISWKNMAGQIVVADFFFTHCPTICPGLTRNMKRLQESITNNERVEDRTNKQVHFLSFSIDPERDSVPRLKYWADRFQVNPDQWWLLSGNKKTIYDLIINDMKVGVEDGQGVDTNFIHTDHFVLLDSNRYVRGYYHGLDSVSLAKLSRDLVLLTLEKGPKEKNFLAENLQLIIVVLLVAMLGVTFLLYYFRKKP